MINKKIGSLIACLFFVFTVSAQKALLKVQNNLVKKGEVFQISVELDGIDGAISIPEKDIQVTGPVSTRQNTIILNSTKKQTTEWIYNATATREGLITIGPAIISTGSKNYKTNTVSLTVSDTKEFLLIPFPNKKTYYPGEPIITRYAFYLSRITNNMQVAGFNFDNATGMVNSFPIKALGSRTALAGKSYYQFPYIGTVTSAINTGAAKVPKAATNLIIENEVNTDIGQFFGIVFGNQETKYIESEPMSVEIIPFPKEGQPSTFINAVGKFDITYSLSQRSSNINDGIKLRIIVSGNGNLDQLRINDLKLPLALKTYLPETFDSLTYDARGLSGTRTFEFVVIPRSGGTFRLAPIQFSYFDPDNKTYKTISGDSIVLEVKGRVVPDDSLELMNSLDTAMVIGPVAVSGGSSGETWFGSLVFWMLIAGGGLLAGGIIGQRKRIMHWDEWKKAQAQKQKNAAWKEKFRRAAAASDLNTIQTLILNGPEGDMPFLSWAHKYMPHLHEKWEQLVKRVELVRYAGETEQLKEEMLQLALQICQEL